MKYSNKIYPNEEQIKGFFEPGPAGPICLVNLLKFKQRAEYKDGRDSALTGREAYELYQVGITKILNGCGGYIGFSGEVERLALGEVEDLWDAVILAVWPSREVMFEVMRSEEMKEISEHRAAGLAGQLNIETCGLAGIWMQAGPQSSNCGN